MLLVAALFAAGTQCAPAQIADAATVSPPTTQDFSAAEITYSDGGLTKPVVETVRWRGPCAPKIVRLFGGRTLVTATGLALWPLQSKLQVRDDKIFPLESEPPHPDWKKHYFKKSASLAAGTWRVGIWVRDDGRTDLARYQPGSETAPIPMLTSRRPIVGVFYLGAPDSVGGTLSFAQRLGSARFRMVSIGWSEAGLRTAAKAH